MANYATSALKLSDTYINTLPYNTCSTASNTAAKTVSAGDFALETGAMVVVKFANANTASSPTLNVSGTGAKSIYYKGSTIAASYLKKNYIYSFVYNGSQWDLVGEIFNDGGNISNHIYLTGANEGSSTANTSQLIFGTSNNNHLALSSNKNALVINPTATSTENQIVLYLNQRSVFPSGITANITGNLDGTANRATADGNGNNIIDTYTTKDSFGAFVIRKDNPHSVTATQTGAIPLSGVSDYTISGNLLFSDTGTSESVFRGLQGMCGNNDYWRVGGRATGSNAGYMEISTSDDGTEPIYVRQYTGVYSTLIRTATLLDANGNTSFPGTISTTGLNISAQGFRISQTDGDQGYGLSLYGSSPATQYGIHFGHTDAFGKHGAITGDWSMYLNTNGGDTTRGWIFRREDGCVASISGGGILTLNGYLKGDTTQAAIKPSDSNEVNFGSNAAYIYFGYDNRIGSQGAINTWKFGCHNGATDATHGKIECGSVTIWDKVNLNYNSTDQCLNFTFI